MIVSPTSIAIVDSVVGRRSGGHQEDYLAALESALRGLGATTFAAFRGGSAAAETKERPPRWKQHWRELRAFQSFLRGRKRCLMVFPNPDFRDFLCFFLAVRLCVRPRRAIALFVLRRNAAGIVGGAGHKARILERLVGSLARSGQLHPVFDSESALRDWRRVTGSTASLVTIPVRERPAEDPPKAESDPVVFGLVGLYRPEKGVRHYDLLVRTALSLPLPVRIRIQLPDPNDSLWDSYAEDLRECWEDRAEVQLSLGHLDADAYTRLMSDVDVLLLPYDVAQYGSGTSGVMFEALELGAVAVATRFQWAVETFANEPRVVWLDAADADFAAGALHEAAKLALEARREKPSDASTGNQFEVSWRNAIAAARARLAG